MKSLYRPEIDGLRAIAVLGVLLFHLKVGLFSGGFLGVDVFFVISGYLITRNILNDVRSENFSFSNFYIRRARHILPALIFIVTASFVCGLLWLPPETMRSLAKESTHALLSIANIQYWREAKEYFAAASDQLPLLHTWSLSLEEQFYLIWPIFILTVQRWNKSLLAIGFAGTASFILATFWNERDPQAVFFLMPFRIFEFAIGAAVIFVDDRVRPKPETAMVLSVTGLLAITASLTLFNEHSSFPMITMLASLGTAGVIAGGAHPISVVLLMNKPALAIGRASYSLYLCHWPIIFFARIIFGEASQTWQASTVSFGIMMLTAFWMRRYIEQPFRQAPISSSNKAAAIRFASLILVLVAMTHTTFVTKGLRWRISGEQQVKAKLLDFGWSACTPLKDNACAFGELNAGSRINLIGDSFAYHYVDVLDALFKENRLQGDVFFDSNCPMVEGVILEQSSWKSPVCRDSTIRMMALLRQNPAPIILSEDWVSYQNHLLMPVGKTGPFTHPSNPYSQIEEGLEKTIADLGQDGRRRFLIVGAQVRMTQCVFDLARILPAPLAHAPPVDCKAKSRVQALAESADINAMLRRVQAKYPNQVRLLLPVDVWCDETECPAAQDGIWFYRDQGHFTSAGSRRMAERAHNVLADFLDGK